MFFLFTSYIIGASKTLYCSALVDNCLTLVQNTKQELGVLKKKRVIMMVNITMCFQDGVWQKKPDSVQDSSRKK